MTSRRTVSLIVGIQGSGKSTQSRMLHDEYDVRWLSVGEILRSIDNHGLKSVLDSGVLVSDNIVCRQVEQAMYAVVEKHILLDGMPRNEVQSRWLIDFVEQSDDYQFGKIVILDLDRTVAINRMLERRRDDDTRDAIERRIDGFIKVKSAIDILAHETDVEVSIVDASPGINEIHAEVVQALGLDG